MEERQISAQRTISPPDMLVFSYVNTLSWKPSSLELIRVHCTCRQRVLDNHSRTLVPRDQSSLSYLHGRDLYQPHYSETT